MPSKKVIFTGLFLAMAGAVLWLCPLPRSFLSSHTSEPLRLLDRSGKLLYESRQYGTGDQDIVPLAMIPPSVIRTLLTTEDRTFFEHGGVSARSILRAAWQNLSAGRVVSGASTITQQLVRNRLPPHGRGVLAKIAEMILSWKLEQSVTKEQILDSYLNTAYFGHQAYGIGSAAKTFFGKDVSELSLAQSALLIGLLQSPSGYDPFRDPRAALARRSRILEQQRDTRDITQEQYDVAMREELHLTPDRIAIRAPHFAFWLLQDRAQELTGSRDVRTTIDLPLQSEAENIVERRLADLKDKNVTSAAVVVLDAHTGDILSMIGSADYFDAAHDGAVNVALAQRQPGSAIKPFTYALAFESGETPATTVADIETQFSTKDGNPYVPRNYDYEEHGLVRYRDALANSYNIAAVKVAERVGIDRLLSFLREVGLTTLTQPPEYYGLALTLGDAEVRLLELTQAYGMFARGGETLPIRNLLEDRIESGRKILDPRAAWLVTSILSDNAARLPEFGGSSPLAFDRPVAAKTGTTRNSRDNWTIGYTPDRIVGVWVGNANNAPMQGTSGVTGAGPIFHDVMEAAVKELPPIDFLQPQGIVEQDVCRLSGMLPTPLCTDRIHEYFYAENVPKEPDSFFRELAVDTRNGLLASDACEESVVRREKFVSFPAELQPWAREHGWRLPPTSASPLCGSSSAPNSPQAILRILTPRNGDGFLLDPLIPDNDERLTLTAQAPQSETVRWYVNDTEVCTAIAPDFRCSWPLQKGTWTISIRAGERSDSIVITVS